MKLKFLCWLAIAALLFAFCGCARTVYMDDETPPGQVPPPAPPRIPPPREPQIEPPQRDTSSEARHLDRAGPDLEDDMYAPDLSAGTIERFKIAYAGKNSPRIAVFLNRQLSDEVREWRTDARAVLSGSADRQKTSEGELEEHTHTEGGISAYEQRHVEDVASPAIFVHLLVTSEHIEKLSSSQ